MEKTFITIFILAVMVYNLVIIGVFLLILKIILLYIPEIHIMGLTIQ